MERVKALVADGDFGFAELLGQRLGELGFEVATAADGEEALRAARRDLPQLLVADEALTRLDGFKLCRLLKFDKQRAAIAVVLMSSAPTDDGRQIAEAVRASAYVPKQVDHQDLLTIAQGLLPKES